VLRQRCRERAVGSVAIGSCPFCVTSTPPPAPLSLADATRGATGLA
jgi:hypothetical protein